MFDDKQTAEKTLNILSTPYTIKEVNITYKSHDV